MENLPEDAVVQLTDSPLKGERWGVAWEWKGEDAPTFKAYGDTREEAIANAIELVKEEEMSPEEAKVWQREAHAEELRDD